MRLSWSEAVIIDPIGTSAGIGERRTFVRNARRSSGLAMELNGIRGSRSVEPRSLRLRSRSLIRDKDIGVGRALDSPKLIPRKGGKVKRCSTSLGNICVIVESHLT